MNTPAHLIFGIAAFGKPNRAAVTGAAIAGALIPDASLYGMVAWHLLVLGTSPDVVFGELYFSDGWMQVFAVDNSFIVWGLLLGLAIWRRSAWAIALTGAALLHLLTDFPLHAGDGRPQFWPLTMWIFDSPYSYWDGHHGGGIIGMVELLACIGLTVWVFLKFKEWWVRGLTALMLVFEIIVGGAWRAFF